MIEKERGTKRKFFFFFCFRNEKKKKKKERVLREVVCGKVVGQCMDKENNNKKVKNIILIKNGIL